jgi:hypothetical protein
MLAIIVRAYGEMSLAISDAETDAPTMRMVFQRQPANFNIKILKRQRQTDLVLIALWPAIRLRMIHAVSSGIFHLAPVYQPRNVGHMRRNIRPRGDHNSVKVLRPPLRLDPASLWQTL